MRIMYDGSTLERFRSNTVSVHDFLLSLYDHVCMFSEVLVFVAMITTFAVLFALIFKRHESPTNFYLLGIFVSILHTYRHIFILTVIDIFYPLTIKFVLCFVYHIVRNFRGVKFS